MASGAAAAAPAVQTVVLRVSIHCHGCKKKVRKVLRSVEGVQSVTVDAAQHKVTVTGTVSADALVQRLHKSGKKGVPWQYCQPPAKIEAAPAPAPAPAPASEALPAPPAQPAGDGGKDAAPAASAADKKPEEAAKEPQAEDSEKKKKPEQEEKKPEAESKGEEKVEAKKGGGDSEAAEPKAKTAEPAAKQEAKEAAAKDEGEPKKDEKPKDAGKPEPAAVTSERSLPAPPPPKHAYEEQYRQPYYAPQPVLSYHAAQPSASVSYFASHPQPQPAYSMQPQQQAYSMQQQQAYSMQQQPMKQWSPSYLYMPYPHAAPEPYYQDYYSPPGMHASPPPMQDSYRIFDDENPNSCSVM